MQQFKFEKTILRVFALTMIGLTAFTIKAEAGGDVFQVFLNNKLILKQFVIEPLTLKNLPLQEVNPNDYLEIFYSHCGTTGKGRSIALKDENGKIFKEWKFADASAGNSGMRITVKEIQELQKKNKNGQLNLYYASHEMPKGRMLASLPGDKKGTI